MATRRWQLDVQTSLRRRASSSCFKMLTVLVMAQPSRVLRRCSILPTQQTVALSSACRPALRTRGDLQGAACETADLSQNVKYSVGMPRFLTSCM